jgi:glyceraldehyde-3-phosphate dehydrogenase (NAD(P))
MQVIGVATRPNSVSLRDAILADHPTYLTDPPQADDYAGRLTSVTGTLEDMLSQVEVLLDCTPSGVPRKHRDLVDSFDLPVTIVQGGEPHSSCDVSFNSMTNFDDARGKRRIRVISCSSTGTTRFIYALDRFFGVRQAFVSLARRAADPGKCGRVPINSLLPTMGLSHHSADVKTVYPGPDILSVSVDCPTTLSHVLQFQIDLKCEVTRGQLLAALQSLPRVVVGRGLPSTAELADYYADLGRQRGDRPEIYVFEDSIELSGCTVLAAISVHMESITIPETVDCIRAALDRTETPWDSIEMTDRSLRLHQPEALYAAR